MTPEEKKWIEDRSYGHYQLISDFVRDCVFKKEMIIVTGAEDVATELRRIAVDFYVCAVDLIINGKVLGIF